MNNKIRSAISHFLVALLVLFSTLTLSAPSAVAQKPQADSKQVGTTYRGILFRCLQKKWPDIRISGDGDSAFIPETGQNLAWDADKKAWIDTKTLQPVQGECKTLRGATFKYCLQKKWPDIRISGDGDSAFIPETGQNLAWDSDKQAWIDTKTLECICPKCPPPRVTTTPAPPSKKEMRKEEKEKEKKQWANTVEPPTVAGKAKGVACKKEDAIHDGRDKVADEKCKGNHNPGCARDCDAGTCQVTAKGSLIGAPPCEKIVKEDCPKSEGWICTVESNKFDCKCRCR